MEKNCKKSNDNNALGNYLRNLRTRRGLNLIDLAAKTGVSQSYISRIEAGDRSSPGIHIIYKLAEGLKTNPDNLIKIISSDCDKKAVDLIEYINSSQKLYIKEKIMTEEEKKYLVSIIENCIKLTDIKERGKND